jgi:GTP cyclohydrolase I
LRSGLAGWRLYPVGISATANSSGTRFEARVDIMYSSTCPGSAALSRQMIQQRFDRDFSAEFPAGAAVREWLATPEAICATPHSQRSIATVRVRWSAAAQSLLPADLVDTLESALATPVQAAVKRADEQAFAQLNGENPMYCEDAVRRLRAAVQARIDVDDYWIRAAHLESLHPHDAVAIAVSGRAGGFSADPV